jgi:hypothetical protein
MFIQVQQILQNIKDFFLFFFVLDEPVAVTPISPADRSVSNKPFFHRSDGLAVTYKGGIK